MLQWYSRAGKTDKPTIALTPSFSRGILMRARPRAAPPPAVRKGRMTYEHEFKLRVVKEALARPPDNRIKPTVSFAA